MEKLHFKTHINAPREKVWKTMLEDATYRIWTKPFHPGSYFEGTWEEGSEIRFLGPSEDGKMGGMFSKIAKNIPNEFISIEHLGMIQGDVIDTTSEEVKKWTPAFENYTFKDAADGGTDLEVDLQIATEYKDMFNGLWPKALEKLKEISEK